MSEIQTFAATAHRAGNAWIAQATLASGGDARGDTAMVSGRTWREIEDLMTDTIARMQDLPVRCIRVELMPQDEEMRAVITTSREAQRRALEAKAEADRALEHAARALKEKLGMSVRDAAAVLGYSFQHISAITKSEN